METKDLIEKATPKVYLTDKGILKIILDPNENSDKSYPEQEIEISVILETMRDAKISVTKLARCGNPPKTRQRVYQILHDSKGKKLHNQTLIWLRYALEVAMRNQA